MKGIVTTLIAMIPSIVLQLPQTADRKDITDAESYAVYHSVLLDQWPIRVARAQRLVIGRDKRAGEGALRRTDVRPVHNKRRANREERGTKSEARSTV